MYNKCIAYKVDPVALAAGVPVEELEKFDIRELKPVSIDYGWRSTQSKDAAQEKQKKQRLINPKMRLGDMLTPEQGKAIKQGQEVKIDNQAYQVILKKGSGRVKIDRDLSKFVGRSFRVRDEKSNSYCLKTLYDFNPNTSMGFFA